MAPVVLEIFVVWHPEDKDPGAEIAQAVVDHFHGTVYSGLIGGAVEVFVRSAPWEGEEGPPRPIPLPGAGLPGIEPAPFVAIVPVLGSGLAAEVDNGAPGWRAYLKEVVATGGEPRSRVRVFPIFVDDLDGTLLEEMFRPCQRLFTAMGADEAKHDLSWLRDLSQELTFFVRDDRDRLVVFVSHTRQMSSEGSGARQLTDLVRSVILRTRLKDFFDAQDLPPGTSWEPTLRENAGRGAFLALRTDRYASRRWCQDEMTIAKQHGLPVVILDALELGEDRGSFLMDHVPRVPVHRRRRGWSAEDVEAGLALLVDEALKRALWQRQEEPDQQSGVSEPTGVAVRIDWWAPHAPEPLTLAAWLTENQDRLGESDPLRILHPDPPLGEPERQALQQILRLSGKARELDVLTPRQLAARGGWRPG